MFTASPQHAPLLDAAADTQRLLTALQGAPAGSALAPGEAPPSAQQVGVVLHALGDFPLCMRILPLAGYRRLGDEVRGVSDYLVGFAAHLVRHAEQTTYDPRYWILGTPVTDRLLRLVATTGDTAAVPSARQAAAVLLALADVATLALPRRVVEVAGSGDLPWNGATGIGRWLRQLATAVAQ